VTRSTDALKPSCTSSSTTNLNIKNKIFQQKKKILPTKQVYPCQYLYPIVLVSIVVEFVNQL